MTKNILVEIPFSGLTYQGYLKLTLDSEWICDGSSNRVRILANNYGNSKNDLINCVKTKIENARLSHLVTGDYLIMVDHEIDWTQLAKLTPLKNRILYIEQWLNNRSYWGDHLTIINSAFNRDLIYIKEFSLLSPDTDLQVLAKKKVLLYEVHNVIFLKDQNSILIITNYPLTTTAYRNYLLSCGNILANINFLFDQSLNWQADLNADFVKGSIKDHLFRIKKILPGPQYRYLITYMYADRGCPLTQEFPALTYDISALKIKYLGYDPLLYDQLKKLNDHNASDEVVSMVIIVRDIDYLINLQLAYQVFNNSISHKDPYHLKKIIKNLIEHCIDPQLDLKELIYKLGIINKLSTVELRNISKIFAQRIKNQFKYGDNLPASYAWRPGFIRQWLSYAKPDNFASTQLLIKRLRKLLTVNDYQGKSYDNNDIANDSHNLTNEEPLTPFESNLIKLIIQKPELNKILEVTQAAEDLLANTYIYTNNSTITSRRLNLIKKTLIYLVTMVKT